jgi:V8-like Glu-specific endopeptidase
MPAAIARRQLAEKTSQPASARPGPGKLGWIVRTSTYIVLTTLSALIVGCAGAADEPVEAHIGASTSNPTIFGGAQDDDALAQTGVVALRVGANGTFELCSGAVLAPNVVLTARHCVTKNITTSVACDQDGRSANGLHVAGDQEPGNIGVYVGSSPSFAQRPVAVARAIVAPQGPYLCDSDIALVILDHALTNVQPLAVRLDAGARAGETIRSVGYGQNDDQMPIGTRFRRAGVAVLAQGQTISASKTPLGPHEFEVGESICQGDSGGPAISELTGAVIGVVSRGGGCDQNFGHIYTTTTGFEDLFDQAFTLAKATPVLEAADDGAAAANGPSAAADTSGAASSGCSSSPARGDAGSALVLALAAALVLRARARARS